MAQNRTSRRRLYLILALVAGVLILAVVVSSALRGDEGMEAELEVAERRDITQIVTASGSIQPEVEVKVSPDVSGEIVVLGVREGDAVQKGQVLVRIRSDFYGAQAEQASAGVLEARAREAQARAEMLRQRAELQRQESLFERRAIPESDVEQARAGYQMAEAAHEAARYAVASAEARLREARENVNKTTIVAPMDGTVSQLNVELGERVVGTSQMSGTELLRIARLDQMEMEVDVNENDVVNVSLGDTADVEVDAYPGRTFHGVVTEIANSARVSGAGTQEQVTNFPVKIRILDPHNRDAVVAAEAEGGVPAREMPFDVDGMANLRPGMSGTVDIRTQTVFDVVAVPIQAVTVRDVAGDDEAGGRREEVLRKVVFVAEADTARRVEVETGISDDAYVEIRSGLAGGEFVVTGPYRIVSRELEQGQLIRVEDRPEADTRTDTVAAAD